MGTGGSIRGVICVGGGALRAYLLDKIRPFQADRRLEEAPYWRIMWSGVEEDEGRAQASCS